MEAIQQKIEKMRWMVHKCYKAYYWSQYLMNPRQDVKHIVSENYFLKSVAIEFYSVFVIEFSKLFKSAREQFSFRGLMKLISNKFTDNEQVNLWSDRYEQLEIANKNIVNNLVVLRDKVIAHTDKGADLSFIFFHLEFHSDIKPFLEGFEILFLEVYEKLTNEKLTLFPNNEEKYAEDFVLLINSRIV